MIVGIIEGFCYSQLQEKFWRLLQRWSSQKANVDFIAHAIQLQEKAVEQQSLYMVYIDWSKAFDTVDR